MKITSQTTGMESARHYRSSGMDAVYHSISRNAVTSASTSGQGSTSAANRKKQGENPQNSLKDLAEENQEDIRKQFEDMKARSSSVSSGLYDDDLQRRVTARCVDYLLLLLFGKETAEKLQELQGESLGEGLSALSGSGTASFSASGPLYQNTVSLHYFEESETTSFSTTGTVVTEDGRSLSFNIDVEMSRSFAEFTSTASSEAIPLTDPLVINLNGSTASVSDRKFYFDLDCDGQKESVSLFDEGSDFLALDRNGDGVINDGSELFGAGSGNGFGDLKSYDEDGNGWIDENDDIFDRLKIWSISSDGTGELIDLRQAGVGALCLGSADTDFTLRSGETGAVTGRIRKTGLFLYENGMAGTLQQVDLASY